MAAKVIVITIRIHLSRSLSVMMHITFTGQYNIWIRIANPGCKTPNQTVMTADQDSHARRIVVHGTSNQERVFSITSEMLLKLM